MIAKDWGKKCNYTSKGDALSKLWYVHTTEDYAAVNGVYTIIICCFKTKKIKNGSFGLSHL